MRSVRRNNVAVEEQQILHILCVSVALIIKHERRMRRIVMPRVACLARPHFSTLFHNPYDFREIIIKENIRFNFSTTSVSNISHSKINSARYYPKCTNVFM